MTVRDLYTRLRGELESGGVESAEFEAAQIMQSVGVDKIKLLAEPNSAVSGDISSEISRMTARRLSGEPLQYILGEWEFYGLPFKVGEGVLIPRQDTETLVEVCLRFLEKRGAAERKVLDLCAGSGCIGIALAKIAGAQVVCVEKSPKAFDYLKENIALNGVEINAVLGDALDENTVRGAFDVIVSNPPYLTESDMMSLQKEVEFEPKAALYGGTDGLDFYRRILSVYPQRLKRGGMLAVEVGMGQASAVSELFLKGGLEPRTANDLCGATRVVYSVQCTVDS